jgi:hypothetical protein
MIGMALPVTFAVLLTPELLAIRFASRGQATRTRRLDSRCRAWSRFRADHEHRARGEPTDGLGHRSEEQARKSVSVMRTDHQQICCNIRGELGDLSTGIIESNVRHQPLERATARASLECSHCSCDVILQVEAGIVGRRRARANAGHFPDRSLARTDIQNV